MRFIRILALLLVITTMIPLCACNNLGEGTTTEPGGTATEEEKKLEVVKNYDDLYEEDMPTIIIQTENKQHITSKEEYVKCEISTANCKDEYVITSVSAGIRLRGNSTCPDDPIGEQAPYRIKFDKKQSMMGLNDGAKCKSWVLLKPEVGNPIAFAFGRWIITEDGYYCSDYRFVEVYLNGEYRGVYVLAEQSQINENRVDVYETPEGYKSYKTGYLLEIDNYGGSEPASTRFYTNFRDVLLTDLEGNALSDVLISDGENINKRYYVLKNDNISSEQLQYIKRYIENVYRLAYNAIMKDKYYEMSDKFTLVNSDLTDAKEVIGRYIDLDSVVNMYILEEISMNTDVGAGSFYMSVDLSEGAESNKLTFECPWDFNWAFEETSRDIGANYEGLSAALFCPDSFYHENKSHKDRSNPWFILFMNAEWFRDMVRERWAELRDAGAFEEALERVEIWGEVYDEEFDAHKKKWGFDLPREVEINYTWLKNRIAWLDEKFFTMDQK